MTEGMKRTIPVNKEYFGDELDEFAVLRISDQLHQQGLIDFKPFKGNDTILAGFGRITARGVDLIEKNLSQPWNSPTADNNSQNIGVPSLLSPGVFDSQLGRFM